MNLEEVFVQVDQLLGRLLPDHLLLVPCLNLPELRQAFYGNGNGFSWSSY